MKRYNGQQRDYGAYYGGSSHGSSSSRYYKKPRLLPTKPPKKNSFDFKINKVVIGEYVADAAKDKSVDMRLQFFLKHDSDPEARSDSITLFIRGGSLRVTIDAAHIQNIRLRQKDGVFRISIDGELQITKMEEGKEVIAAATDDPLFTYLVEHKRMECQVDMNQPVTQPKRTKENIIEWSKDESPFRKILEVLDEDQAKPLEDIFISWARQSSIGLHSDRLLFAKLQLPKLDRLLDIVIRLVRKETSLAPAVDGLVVLMKSMADRAGVEREELERLVVPVVQLVPEHLIFRALDGMWRAEGVVS